MIKCPKCGSTSIAIERRPDGWSYCKDCSYSWRHERKEPELTVAEKLLWLVKNQYSIDTNTLFEVLLVQPKDDKNVRIFEYGKNKGHKNYETLEAAIEAAYLWAKEQEK